MVESKIYIGLNDLSTNTQLFENEKYIRVLRNVCYSYKVPFSFQVQEGGYIYESGEYARETSLVLTLIDVDKTVVKDIAKDLCAFFRSLFWSPKVICRHISFAKHWNAAVRKPCEVIGQVRIIGGNE